MLRGNQMTLNKKPKTFNKIDVQVGGEQWQRQTLPLCQTLSGAYSYQRALMSAISTMSFMFNKKSQKFQSLWSAISL